MTTVTLQDRRNQIVDVIASKAQADYVRVFHEGPAPKQADRINVAGDRVNFKKTEDQIWIQEQRSAGLVLTGGQAQAKPKGSVIEIDGVVYVDIAGRQYDDLPLDLKALNQSSARVAAEQLILAGSKVHDRWVEDNSWQVADVAGTSDAYGLLNAREIYAYVAKLTPEQREKLELFVPFEDLIASEQDKDLIFVVQAAHALSKSLHKGIADDIAAELELGIQVASDIHDDWVIENRRVIADAALDNSVLELETPAEVYGFVAKQSQTVRNRLELFVPFSELSAEEQHKSLAFVIEAAGEIEQRIGAHREALIR